MSITTNRLDTPFEPNAERQEAFDRINRISEIAATVSIRIGWLMDELSHLNWAPPYKTVADDVLLALEKKLAVATESVCQARIILKCKPKERP